MADQTSSGLGQKQKASSKLLELALNATHLGVVVCDVVGNVTFFNAAAERISGLSAEQAFAAKSPAELFPNELETTYLRDTIQAKGQIEGHRLIFEQPQTGKTTSAKRVTADLYGTLLYEEGEQVGSLWIIIDKTEEAKLLSELIHSEKMATLSQLSYGIAHEFNNIIAGLQGFAQLANLPGKEDRMRQLPDMVIRYSMRAKEIVDNLFAFAGSGESEISIVDINATIELTLKLITRDLSRHEITIKRDFGELPMVTTDADRFKHVLLNLMVNARNAMKNGGNLSIATSLKDEFIEIDVSDTGKGIPEDILPHIFEPFYATKRYLIDGPGDGLGLGLSACYGIMQDLGGDIQVTSEAGKGCMIKLLLPINTPEASAAGDEGQSAVRVKSPSRGKSILIADDEETIRMSLVEFLDEMGYKTQAEPDGHSALKAARDGDWDVAIFDITMPGGGMETIRELISINPDTKIFIITGHGGPYLSEIRKECEELGVAGVFPKPFNLKDLLIAIEKKLA